MNVPKVEIIPAINAAEFSEVEKKIRAVEPYANWAHLDVADGTFTPNTLWHDAADLLTLKTPLLIEAHLMVAEPEKAIDAWIAAGAKRIIIHVEAITDFDYIKRRCDERRVLLMLAITPTTPWTRLVPFLGSGVISFQALAVSPGLAGQAFSESSYETIRSLRARCADCDIEADGGLNVQTIKNSRDAGANLFAAASAIFGAASPSAGMAALKRAIL